MPDISMCQNRGCKSRMRCYRYRAVPEKKWQSYSAFTVLKGKDRCCNFIRVRKADALASDTATGKDTDASQRKGS